MSKTFYTAGRLLLAVSILASSAIESDHDAAGIAQAASAPLPEGHPTIDAHGSAAPAAPRFDFSKIVKPKAARRWKKFIKELEKGTGRFSPGLDRLKKVEIGAALKCNGYEIAELRSQ